MHNRYVGVKEFDMSEGKLANHGIWQAMGIPFKSQEWVKMMMSDGSVLAPSIQRLRDKLAGQANRMIDLFRRWDRNHDSNITKDEFTIMLPELGLDNCMPTEGACAGLDPSRPLKLPPALPPIDPLSCRLRGARCITRRSG